ncbi:MAG: hypothetical protein DPW11_00310 [bacterium]|nr:hypothetical protein [bacterium]RIK51734.1 MAG: hypothetical protein DCC61_01495 [Candidatus Microgenomates bacterium]
MKICKSCKKEIDDKASKCPHCTADQRIWFAKHPILTVILVLIVIGMVGSGKSGNKTTSNTGNPSQSTSESSKPVGMTYKIGETFSTGKMDFTMISVDQKSMVGGQYLSEKASEGATLIVAQYKYKNSSDKPLSSFTQPSVKLTDAKGTEYDADLGKTSTYKVQVKMDEKFLSDLNPGITVNAAQVFEVSKDSYLQPGWKIKVSSEGGNYFIEVK